MGFKLIEAGRPSWSRCTLYEISPHQTIPNQAHSTQKYLGTSRCDTFSL
jgi:hypothetical protein